MSEREDMAESIFATPKVVGCTLALVYPRQAEIRRRGNEIEDVLKADYEPPQVINSSDDAPQEVPRFLIPSKDGRRVIGVSQVSMQMNLLFPDKAPSDLTTFVVYVTQHYREVFAAFATIKGVSPLFFGVTTQVRIPTQLNNEQLLKLFVRQLLKSPEETRSYFDLQVKQTKVLDKKLFHNITLANYRTYKFDTPPATVPRFPMNKVIEHGVEITGDVNDRYAYNRQQAYRTSIVAAEDIMRYAVTSLEGAIAQVKAMAG